MTIQMTFLRRATAAVAVAGLLGFGLAACGSDADDPAVSPGASETSAAPVAEPEQPTADAPEVDVAAFCAAAVGLGELTQFEQSDMDAALAKMNEVMSALNVTVAPAEVAEDWAVVVRLYTDLVDTAVVALNDPTNTDAEAEVKAAMGAMYTPDAMVSQEKVTAYVTTACR